MKLIDALKNLYITTKPKPWKLQKPVVIQFPVNDICNSKCQMCNIWQQKFDYQITPNELEKAVSNPLFSEVRTIGINGGEPTLRKDLAELVDVLFKKLPNLSGIALITNSLISSQVIQRITEIGQVVKSHKGHLDVMVSLDGFGDVHDRVRGRKGNFENAVKVIDFIQSSDLVSNRRLGCTVLKENIYGVHDLLEFAISKDIYIKYRLGIPHQRLYSKDVVEPFDLTFEEKYHFAIFLENLIKFYEKSEQQNFFYTSLIGQLIYQKPRAAGCDWQHRGATLSARGELLYCAVESKTLGSAITEDAEQLYFDNNQHLADILQNKCDICAHDYVGIPPKMVLIKTYAERLLEKAGVSLKNVKQFEILKPVKSLRQQADLNRKMALYGVNQATLGKSQPATCFPRNSASNRKVLICGWYGTETLGDKAILGGVVQSFQGSLGNIELHLACLELFISEMTVRQMPELQGCKLHSITEAIEIANSMDLVVFGGGPLMAIVELTDMIAIFQKAVEAKIPTLIAGCGVGPLGASHYNDAIKHLLLSASHRIYRDKKSLQIAKSLGIDTASDQVAEDPAFTWLKTSTFSSQIAETQSNNSEHPSLILGLRDWTYKEYAKDLSIIEAEAIKQRFEKEVVTAIEQLVNKYPSLRIIPFPMCTNHLGHDDRWFYRNLFRNHKNIYDALDLTYLGAEISPLDAINTFKSASIALTMRFHSLVFALSSGVPTVGIDYTLGRGKVTSLAEKHNVPYMSLSSINAEFIVSSLSKLLDENKQESQICLHPESLKFQNAVSQFIKSLE
ncbi:polysaccharide pyruvyl transferase family protein [Mastigocoleus sp. MO_188.B34]|uniref:polysaccharide pyruvyl transferase family protein n=1 Tax=Mastigocoleus sp. MO_188.B34 TaxID=3036635 RepID=UPI0026113DDC|nr:polysaccharide pyruvyl transferase family protein [Mastigocoleus sp. MO_188.B34]MDJ0696539.1 polysaccharide pyruvyl transferase family protein [Mastigocoleus sp. MO_188.B34]